MFNDYALCTNCHSNYKPVDDVCMICCDKSARKTPLTENPELHQDYSEQSATRWIYGTAALLVVLGLAGIATVAYWMPIL